MAKRDDDDADEAEGIQEKPRRKQPRDDDAQAEKPRRTKPARDDWDEDDDRRRRPPRRSDRGRDDDAVSTIIPYHNGMALAAYYVGVFSLIPCLALILGPLGIIFGIIGLRRVKQNPEIKGTGHAIAGIVLGSITSLANYGTIIGFVIAGIMSHR